jgi:hypothetical protein
MTASSWRGFLAALPLLLPGATVAFACGDKVKKDARQVRVSVVIILASETKPKVDRKVRDIAAEVKKIHPKLKGFELKDLQAQSVKIGVATKFDLLDGQSTTITIKGAADKMDRIQLRVGPPSMGGITYATPCGKFLPIVTPYVTKNNEKLIIAIRVEPCKGK